MRGAVCYAVSVQVSGFNSTSTSTGVSWFWLWICLMLVLPAYSDTPATGRQSRPRLLCSGQRKWQALRVQRFCSTSSNTLGRRTGNEGDVRPKQPPNRRSMIEQAEMKDRCCQARFRPCHNLPRQISYGVHIPAPCFGRYILSAIFRYPVPKFSPPSSIHFFSALVVSRPNTAFLYGYRPNFSIIAT